MYRFEVEGRPILVVKLGAQYYAADSTCTHQEADLSLGILIDGIITCPLHQAKFNVSDGSVIGGPDGSAPESIPKLRVYSTLIQGDELFIELPLQ